MNNRSWLTITVVVAFSIVTPATAETLTGADKILCAPARLVVCVDDGSCESLLPWEVNVPEFIVVDLREKRLSTTEASAQNRSTPIQSLIRQRGLIYLQGVEGERAFSIVINEETGFTTVAVARSNVTVNAFGTCTTTD